MPVTAKLSRRFYEQLGDEVANELVEWFNAVDATYKSDLRELNELNWHRFRAELAETKAELRSEMAAMKAELRSDMAAMKADLMKWMFLFWAGTVVPLAALILAVASQVR